LLVPQLRIIGGKRSRLLKSKPSKTFAREFAFSSLSMHHMEMGGQDVTLKH
jgi:hypothetical protein